VRFAGVIQKLKDIYETAIPTIQNPAQTTARLSRPRDHEKRSRDSFEPAACGPQALNPCLIFSGHGRWG
jgi:hypothetical protein